MLKEIMSEKELAELFRKKEFQTRFPAASCRADWCGKDEFHRRKFDFYVKSAEFLKNDTSRPIYPQLTAKDYFAFIRNGNRSGYEFPYFTRRSHLAVLSIAEAIEYRKRFLPDVVEGLWQLMNEAVWTVPAHGAYREGDPMPRLDQPRTDLFCAETGATFAFVVQLLEDDLARESAEMLTWIKKMCIERVIEPVENSAETPQWWLDGYNNWGPWCACNVAMTAFTFLWDQPERLAKLIFRLIETCEKFYNRYAPDGGCDEGPSYFMVAGVQLMAFLDLLNFYTDNAYASFYSEEKFRNIGDYIAKVHLTGPWFASMADATAKNVYLNPGNLNRFAEMTGSSLLKEFAVDSAYGFRRGADAELYFDTKSEFGYAPVKIIDDMRLLFWHPVDLRRENTPLARMTVLPDLQFFLFRQNCTDDRSGTVFCMKGGHNEESHNHNDVGQFEVFYDGAPVVIDCGATEYTRFTFSEHRYENCFLSAAGHNVPEINGFLQPPGREFESRILALSDDVTLEISKAYPKAANIRSCTRRAALSADGVALIENAVEGNGKISIKVPLFCAVKPEALDADSVKLGKMKLHVSGLSVEAVEELSITDTRMRYSWGAFIWKITLKGEFMENGQWSLKFIPVQ